MRQIIEILLLLLAFVAILWGAQYVSKKVASISLRNQAGKCMQLIESLTISPGKMLQIIQVGKRYFLVAVYKEGIRYLTEIQEENVLNKTEELIPARFSPFAEHFKKLKEKAGERNEKKIAENKTE